MIPRKKTSIGGLLRVEPQPLDGIQAGKDTRPQHRQKQKDLTCSSQDSHVVTHHSTN